VQALVEVIGRSGAPIASAGRILEFGCGAGRMIRWLADLTATCEVWGTDISASAIVWCQQHLTPPFHFATTTIWPHLPFEDRYFGLIYAGSVFTHLDDLADAWFLELRRILRPGGKLYITVHDRNTVALFNGREREQWLPQYLRTIPEYEKFSRSDFGMFTIGRSLHSQVFYDVDFLRRKLEPFFRVLSITEEAYNYQSAVLLERL
jgi:SAM-dependent methyltransferase